MPDSGEMPWKETDSVKERIKFVLEWERRWDEGFVGTVIVVLATKRVEWAMLGAQIFARRSSALGFKRASCDC